MPLLNCIVLLASHFRGIPDPARPGPWPGRPPCAQRILTEQMQMHPNMQPNRGACYRYPYLACDKSNKLSYMVAHSSCMSPIGDSVGAASAPPGMVTPRDRGC